MSSLNRRITDWLAFNSTLFLHFLKIILAYHSPCVFHKPQQISWEISDIYINVKMQALDITGPILGPYNTGWPSNILSHTCLVGYSDRHRVLWYLLDGFLLSEVCNWDTGRHTGIINIEMILNTSLLSALPGCAVETRSSPQGKGLSEGVSVRTKSLSQLGVIFRALVVGMFTLPLIVLSLIYTLS